MSVNVIRRIGRPTVIQLELAKWGVMITEEIKSQQEEFGFVATGDSLDDYTVIINQNNVQIIMADYLKYSMEGRGRRPGGKMPPINIIADWLVTKGIEIPKDWTLRGFAYVIARKQQAEGNQVYRGDRQGIRIADIIDDSFDGIRNEIALNVINDAATRILKRVQL